ncbi:hypothetical protein QFZ42_003308 [Variovorax paradoxus]|uniref:hypothetical protein n=1 Tax=Variovorax paradoxus TaxID=34073 RepID=UPI002794D6F9|nr:hypothetical protein [Variovorax paradoxus]MDQ0571474.1 hypothetical protein [Variovorax paradoxus]
MAQFLAPLINDQQEDANGNPLSGGQIEVYLAGTSTPATTTSDKAGLIPNTWPVVLSTLGVNNQGAVWITGGATYKFVIKNAAGVVQRTIDNISGINDNSVVADQWIVFQATPTFVSATSFTVPGDQTQTFTYGTRVKTTNTGGIVYGTVVRSTFAAATTVVIVPDSGSLDSGLSVVSVGLITPSNPALPGTLATPSFRNRIINGSLRIDQRAISAGVTLTAGAAIGYVVDRCYASCTGANVTIQKVAGTGYQSAVTITGAAANTATLFGQRIESSNCFDWVGQQVNVQIPISAVGITSVTWNAYVANATDNFAAKTLLATGSLTLSGTVENKAFSFSAGTNASRGIAIEFVTGALLAGQSITYQGAWQAEVGQLSPFERVEYGEELRRCRRYYYRNSNAGTGLVASGLAFAANSAAYYMPFPVTLRASPTLGSSNLFPTNGAGTTIAPTGSSLLGISSDSALVQINVAAGLTIGQASLLYAGAGAGGYIEFIAEL